ncbi:MAG: hypothetical protein AAB289_04865 [Chloroflexota bacterium]
MTTMAVRSKRIEVANTGDAVLNWIEQAFENGWSDGLPVVPPTIEKVQAMLAVVDRDPQELLGEVPPRGGRATIETVAIQAVMGGCKPEYFPVVIAAVEAMLEPLFNLNGIQSTTNSVAPLCIVSGPIVEALGMNSGSGVFGGGNRANGTIGRAIRLVLWNLGGGYPERGDKDPEGTPAKWSYCIAERREDSPWESLHEERGFAWEQSCVTMFGCRAPHSLSASVQSGKRVLDIVARSLRLDEGERALGGCQTAVVFTPGILQVFKAEHWTKRDVKAYLYEKARVSLGELREWWGEEIAFERMGGVPELGGQRWPRWLDALGDDPNLMIPVMRNGPDSIHLVGAGGYGVAHASICPGWGYMGGLAVTKPIRQ